MENEEIKKQRLSESQLKSELISLFESGITNKSNCYEHLRTKYKVMKQRCLKSYDIYHTEWAILKEKTQNDIIVESEKDRLKKDIISKDEALVILSKTAKGIAQKMGEEIMIPTFTDKINAIKTIATLQGGWLVPTKIAQTNKNGDDINSLSSLSTEKLIKLEQILSDES